MIYREIKEIYDAYTPILNLLTIQAGRGCKTSARQLIVVMTEREKTIQAFGWCSVDVDGEESTFKEIVGCIIHD